MGFQGSPFDALVAALILAVEAPTDTDSQRAVKLAQSFAAQVSREDVKRAKVECVRILSRKVH